MVLKDRVALVTGSSRGIGKEIAIQLARSGATVCTVCSSPKSIESQNEGLPEEIKFDSYICNVSDEEKVNAVCKEILDKYGRVDILVNNAGLWRSTYGPFAESDSADWRRKIEINILGTMYFCRALIGSMIENKYGRIINIASVAGVYGKHNMADYAMTKGAIIAFTTSLAQEVGEFGVTANCVSPGNIQSTKETPNRPELSFIGRSGSNEECANVVSFLASEEASYVSGQNYLVDGCRKIM